MQLPVKERVAKLRQEIAEIATMNREYIDGQSKGWPPEKSDYARRQARLQEIKDELAALNEWRKT